MTPHADLHHAHPGVTFAQAAAELTRERDARRSVDAAKIERGRMDPAVAAERQEILAAIAADLERVRAADRGYPTLSNGPQAEHRFTWRQRDRELLGELATRRKLYPEWISAGRLDQAEADRRIRILAAIHALYEDGLDWPPNTPADPDVRSALTHGIMQRRDPNWIDLARCAPAMADYHTAQLARAAELGIIPAKQEELAFA